MVTIDIHFGLSRFKFGTTPADTHTMKWLQLLTTIALSTSCKPNAGENASDVKIIGGNVASENDPVTRSTMFLYMERQGNGAVSGGSCTGTLIGPNQIATAAHCLSDGARLVSIGYGSRVQRLQGIGSIRWKVHERYVGAQEQLTFDLAVITFDGNLPTSLKPTPVGIASDVVAGREVIFAGYGLTATNNLRIDEQLRRVTSSIDQIDTLNGEILDKEDGLGTCQGDSGGPMYVESPSGLRVIGATSRGQMSCEAGDGVYTNLPHYRQWMAEAFTNLGKPLQYLSEGSLPNFAGGGSGIEVDIAQMLP